MAFTVATKSFTKSAVARPSAQPCRVSRPVVVRPLRALGEDANRAGRDASNEVGRIDAFSSGTFDHGSTCICNRRAHSLRQLACMALTYLTFRTCL